MTKPRNENPLHNHADEPDPWTADTLWAHLMHLHGVVSADLAAMSLTALTAVHDGLEHGQLTKLTRDAIYEDALRPERRHRSIELVPCRWHDGEQALEFSSAGSNSSTLVCLTAADMPLLRAVLIPENPDLKTLQDQASAALGPGARKFVQQAHSAGYRIGVTDMEAIHQTMAEAERVSDWLGGLAEAVTAPGAVLDTDPAIAEAIDPAIAEAIDTVRDLIKRRMDEQEASRG